MADTFTGSIQTHKQNKYTLSRPRMHADTPSLTPRGAHMHHSTSTVRYRWFRDDRDTFHRRRPCRQEMASVGRPARYAVELCRRSTKARGAPASRHASTSKHGPAARKNDSKSSFPANALLMSPSRRVVAIEATRSGSISHRAQQYKLGTCAADSSDKCHYVRTAGREGKWPETRRGNCRARREFSPD